MKVWICRVLCSSLTKVIFYLASAFKNLAVHFHMWKFNTLRNSVSSSTSFFVNNEQDLLIPKQDKEGESSSSTDIRTFSQPLISIVLRAFVSWNSLWFSVARFSKRLLTVNMYWSCEQFLVVCKLSAKYSDRSCKITISLFQAKQINNQLHDLNYVKWNISMINIKSLRRLEKLTIYLFCVINTLCYRYVNLLMYHYIFIYMAFYCSFFNFFKPCLIWKPFKIESNF